MLYNKNGFKKTYRMLLLVVLLIGCKYSALFGYDTIRDVIYKYDINGMDRPGGTDKDTSHSYVEVYEALLEKFRNKDSNLLEIGVQYGGSAIIWREYLPKSKLFLVDIEEQRHLKAQRILNSPRCSFNIMDAYTNDAITKMRDLCPEGFDIIIEDGPHTLESQLFVVSEYSKLLRKGGVLVIEDIPSDDWLRILQSKANETEMKTDVVDLRMKKGRWDDLLLIISNEK